MAASQSEQIDNIAKVIDEDTTDMLALRDLPPEEEEDDSSFGLAFRDLSSEEEDDDSRTRPQAFLPDELGISNYINPDELYDKPRTNYKPKKFLTFVYNHDIGLIVSPKLTHTTLLRKEEILGPREAWGDDQERTMLLGRMGKMGGLGPAPEYGYESGDESGYESGHTGSGYIGSEKTIISFWNRGIKVYDLLGPCLKALEQYVSADQRVEIHTPHGISHGLQGHDTKKIGETELSPERNREIQLLKQMHLMRGDEKKAAMKELGLWDDRKAQHPWQKELAKAGEIGPGQKWWASQFEQINDIAKVIAEDA